MHVVPRNSLVKFIKGSTALSDPNVKVITAECYSGTASMSGRHFTGKPAARGRQT